MKRPIFLLVSKCSYTPSHGEHIQDTRHTPLACPPRTISPPRKDTYRDNGSEDRNNVQLEACIIRSVLLLFVRKQTLPQCFFLADGR